MALGMVRLSFAAVLVFGALSACSNVIGLSDYEAVETGGSSGTGGVAGSTGGTGGVAGSTGGTGGVAGSTGGTGGVAGSTGGTGGVAGSTGGTGGEPACTPPNGGPCDNFPQCRCPGNDNCTLVGPEGTGQCVSSGQAQPYTRCTFTTDCGKGHHCVGSACKPYCEGLDATCPGPRAACKQISMAGGDPLPGAFYCSRTCHPGTPTTDDGKFEPCGPDLACTANTSGASDCYGPPTPSGTQGVTCTSSLDCAIGFVCVSPANECRKWCTVRSGGTECSAGHLCEPFGTPTFAADVEFGACVPCVPPAGGATSQCDTTPICGCRATENCRPSSDGTTRCEPAGTAQPFQACSTSQPCTRGNVCLGGVCAPYCENASATCAGLNARCKQATASGGPVPGFFYCTRTCNPLSPQQENGTYDACGPGLNCFPSSDRASDCLGPTTASGTHGASCGNGGQPDDGRCAPGHLCGPDLTCARFCALPGGTCPSGVCTPFVTPSYAGPTEIGVCI